MKILNLYAGIGGNRMLWSDEHDIVAVELDGKIADVYRDLHPQDTVIEADAHEYLKEHFHEFDFIWSSPPCPTHSKIRNEAGVGRGQNEPVYPDMKLYEEILFLQHFTEMERFDWDGSWVIENVISYYDPLIEPQKRQRHYFWSNFNIPKLQLETDNINTGTIKEHEQRLGVDLSGYGLDSDKRMKMLRNCVHPKLGKHIFESRDTSQQGRLEDF